MRADHPPRRTLVAAPESLRQADSGRVGKRDLKTKIPSPETRVFLGKKGVFSMRENSPLNPQPHKMNFTAKAPRKRSLGYRESTIPVLNLALFASWRFKSSYGGALRKTGGSGRARRCQSFPAFGCGEAGERSSTIDWSFGWILRPVAGSILKLPCFAETE